MHASPATTGVPAKMRNCLKPTPAQASYRPAEEVSELQEPSHPTKPEPQVGGDAGAGGWLRISADGGGTGGVAGT